MGVFLFIPTNDFPSLTHLILDGAVMHNDPEGPYTFFNFLRFLSRCPNLEVLHFTALDVARLQEVPNGLIDAPVQLPRLRKFSNEESLVDETRLYRLPHIGPQFRRAILEHLQLSPDCVIRLATILPHELGQTLESLPFDKPFTSLYLSAHNHLGSSPLTSEPNGIEPECFSIMATDPLRQRGVRIDFQMPGTRYAPRNVTTQSARARLGDGIRAAPLLSRVHELWVVSTATLLLGEPCSLLGCLPHLTTLVLGLHPLALDAKDDARDHWEPLRALEVRDDFVIPCPRLRTLCVYVSAEEHVMQLYDVLLSRGDAGYPVHRLVVGFYGKPTLGMLELAEGLWGLVEDFTLLEGRGRCPDDLLWVDRLPSVCRDRSEWNVHWPAWM
ncbi:hypothetical protein GSI_14403 [Ganoderma sinense ZZ0214-1]|uniref:F-box domain-containing protein n=1 Tax=Ganoderma sinense ZZ0214-1 TaxID=1077348 RepID=A0A2G8RNJ8_9APHY|nr:hypothetical protein GSI_14403 [Ganoderma sinense ZZ0214-1]